MSNQETQALCPFCGTMIKRVPGKNEQLICINPHCHKKLNACDFHRKRNKA